MGNRKFVFIPEINSKTFLFFYHEGSSGKSFSFREYPAHGKPKVKYSKAYPSYSADQILKLAHHVFDAPTHPTTDNEFWHAKIQELNERYLGHKESSAEACFKRISPPKQPVIDKKLKTSFYIKSQGGRIISSVDDWHIYAPPKEPIKQWQDGKSAKELAKAWFRNGKFGMPAELNLLLKSNPLTLNFSPSEGYAEYKTPLDKFSGPRNHDLILIGNSDRQKILVAIEAKETEDFQGPIAQKRSDNPNSEIEPRKQLLSEQLFGRPIDQEIGLIQYQLLTGTAGTLIEAKNRGSEYAVFIVHEFLTSQSDMAKSERNSIELNRFVKGITRNKVLGLKSGNLIDIGCLPGGQFVPNNIPLLIGKVTSPLS